MNTKTSIDNYYLNTIAHRNEHKCGGYPFENGQFLTNIVSKLKPSQILEIGTSIGFSATCLALGHDESFVTTLDLNSEHVDIASKYWQEFQIEKRIEPKVVHANDYLPKTNTFDLIFYDAFAPDPTLSPKLVESLTTNGVIISTNLELPAELMTGDEYLDEIKKAGLENVRHGDIAFSSKDRKVLHHISKIWTELQP